MGRRAKTDRANMTPEDLLAIRKAMKLTQVDFAEALGLARSSYLNYERGYLTIPGPVAKLAACLLSQSKKK